MRLYFIVSSELSNITFICLFYVSLFLYFVGDGSLNKFDDAPLELEGKKLYWFRPPDLSA